jgi:hypothetical protein
MNYSPIILSLIFTFLSLYSKAQQDLVGKIVDASTKEPLIYCHILNKTSFETYITNQEGEYRINRPSITDTLLISYLGYSSIKISVREATKKRTIYLEPDAIMLSEVSIAINDKAILDQVKKCARKLNQSVQFTSKAYLELYTQDEENHLELLQMYYNVKCQGAHIPLFFLKTGRVALTDQADKTFVNLGSTQALASLNPGENSDVYPLNPLLLSIKENKKRYYIRKIYESTEQDLLKLEFEPKILKDSLNLFSGEIWMRKSDQQLLKLRLKTNEALKNPFSPIRENDILKRVAVDITYHFNKIQAMTRLTLVDFKFGFDYISSHKTDQKQRRIQTEGIIHLYDEKELFVLPIFFYDYRLNDYRKASLIPYDSTFWERNKALEVTEKQKERYKLFSQNGILLNFTDITRLDGKPKTTFHQFGNFFEFNNIVWNKDAVIRLKSNSDLKRDVADIKVQLFLDINKYGDSLFYNSYTILDVFQTTYNLENKPEHLAYINIYFDLCEMIRREMEEKLNKTQSLKEVINIHIAATDKLKETTVEYNNDVNMGYKIRKLPEWNNKVFEALHRNHIKQFGVIIPDY